MTIVIEKKIRTVIIAALISISLALLLFYFDEGKKKITGLLNVIISTFIMIVILASLFSQVILLILRGYPRLSRTWGTLPVRMASAGQAFQSFSLRKKGFSFRS